ncbi:MAG: hypothetical protein COB69_05955 [Phycisphaera sp.]|nr:MAG: hypothetical protein COB69_05955 [Phycisphaera sp.]
MSSDQYNPSEGGATPSPALSYSQTEATEKTECLLFDFVPERTKASRYQPQINLQLLELGHGPARLDTDKATPNPLTFTNNYRLNSFVDLAEIEAFFEARLGRNESFCLPSWQEDLRLSADTSAGVDYLPIQTHDVTLYIGQNILVYKAGSYFVRTITTFGDGYIELNSGIPFTVTTDDSISIIYRVTFASDSLELAHQTSENVDIELSFVEEIREAGQVSEIIDTDTDLNAICYSTMTEAQYLLLEETDYALLTTSCEALGDGDGIVTAI